MTTKDMHKLRREELVYYFVAVLCILLFITVCAVNLANGQQIEAYFFGALIGAAGAFAGGKKARDKIKALEH